MFRIYGHSPLLVAYLGQVAGWTAAGVYLGIKETQDEELHIKGLGFLAITFCCAVFGASGIGTLSLLVDGTHRLQKKIQKKPT